MRGYRGFIGVVSLSGIQTLVRLGLGLLSVKVTAVAFGPEGIGLIAQLGTFITLLGGLLANGAATSVINLFHRSQKLPNGVMTLANQCSWIVVFSLIAICVIAIFSNFFSTQLLGSESNSKVIWIGLLVVPFFVAGSLMQSWVNANEAIKALYLGQIGCNVVGFALLYWAALNGSLTWSLIAVAVSYAVPAIWFGTYWLQKLHCRHWFSTIKTAVPSSESLRSISQVFKFYPMLLVHSVAMPLTLLIVRWLLTAQDGGQEMGVWQAGWRLSELYVGMVTMAAASYFAPKLARTVDDPSSYWRLVQQLFISVIGAVVLLAATLLATRAWLIPFVFSDRFLGAVDLMPIQLLSDIPRAVHWCVGLVLVSCLARRNYVVLELAAVIVLCSVLILLKGTIPNATGFAFLIAFSVTAAIGSFLLWERKTRVLSR